MPSGGAAVEVALMSPWLFLLFIAVFDFGFYGYAAITTANAARVAALWTSSDPGRANPADANNVTYLHQLVAEEMASLPNTRSLVGSPAYSYPPLSVSMALGAEPEGEQTSIVTVRYQTVPLFPLPWLRGQFEITRLARMRVRR